MKENQISRVSPGGATFQTTSSLHTEAILFLKKLGSGPGPGLVHKFFGEEICGSDPDRTRTRPGPDPKFQFFFPNTFETQVLICNYSAPGG